MNDGPMADAHLVPNQSLGALISTVNHGAILYIHPIAHSDAVHISAYYGMEPETAIVATNHISD
jgi:hypothetical protein